MGFSDNLNQGFLGGGTTGGGGGGTPVPTSIVNTDFIYGNGFFFNHGLVLASLSVTAVQPDGKILVGGGFDTYNTQSVGQNFIRLNPDGSIDTSFNVGIGFDDSVLATAVQSDGKILCGGVFNNYNGNVAYKIIRLNTDGSFDNTFYYGTGFDSDVYSIVVQPDGKILVGGAFTLYNGNTAKYIIRLNSDGIVDTSFVTGNGFDDVVNSIAIQSNGKILLGGGFTSYDGSDAGHLIRVNQDGSLDSSFVTGSGFGDSVFSIAVQSDGKILAGGAFNDYNGVEADRLIRLNPDGLVDTSFVTGGGFDTFVFSIAIQSNGKIIVGGEFNSYNNVLASKIVRLNSDGSVDTTWNTGSGFIGVVAQSIAISSSVMYVAGTFTSFDGVSTNSFICLNQTYTPAKTIINTGFNYGTGFNGLVKSLALQSDGKLICGGDFDAYNGNTAGYIVRLLTDGTIDSSFITGSGFNGSVLAIAIQTDGKILCGGNFNTYNGDSSYYLVRLGYDGLLDTTFTFNDSVYSIAIQPDGKILVGGAFNDYNGVEADGIIRLNPDGSIDTPFVTGNGFDGAVHSIAVQPDGKILVGGQFASYNGTTANKIIRLNTDGSVDNTFYYGAGFDGSVVINVVIQSDGKILCGGNFNTYNGNTANYIIRLNTDGSVDTSFVTGNGTNDVVLSIAIQSDNKILLGGDFQIYNGTASNFIARLNTDGSIDLKFRYGASFNSSVWSLAINNTNSLIYAGGAFTNFDSTPANNIVCLNQDYCQYFADNLTIEGNGTDVPFYATTAQNEYNVNLNTGNYTIQGAGIYFVTADSDEVNQLILSKTNLLGGERIYIVNNNSYGYGVTNHQTIINSSAKFWYGTNVPFPNAMPSGSVYEFIYDSQNDRFICTAPTAPLLFNGITIDGIYYINNWGCYEFVTSTGGRFEIHFPDPAIYEGLYIKIWNRISGSPLTIKPNGDYTLVKPDNSNVDILDTGSFSEFYSTGVEWVLTSQYIV